MKLSERSAYGEQPLLKNKAMGIKCFRAADINMARGACDQNVQDCVPIVAKLTIFWFAKKPELFSEACEKITK